MSVPAHKVTGNVGKPGQQTFDRYPDIKHLTADQTLSDYIVRKQRDVAFNEVKAENKMTFEEWYSRSGWATRHEQNCSLDDADSCKYMMMQAWQASQEQSE